MIKEIENNNFNEVRESKGYAFVDFNATWCGPCRMLSPIMEEIAKSNTVYAVDVDLNDELATEFNVNAIPCVILFKDGKEYKRSVGLKTKEELEGMID